MIILSGIGLFDIGDIPLKTVEAAKIADRIILESYTSYYHSSISDLEALFEKKVEAGERKLLEEDLDELIEYGKNKNLLILVMGDPLTATTHVELLIEARKKHVNLEIIHASSIYSAVAETGLQPYKFGKTTTLAFPEENYKPTSPYDVIVKNQNLGLHTLVLLDVKADEGRYMSVNEGVELLMDYERELAKGTLAEQVKVLGCARFGSPETIIKFGTLNKLSRFDFGKPPHCIIIPGNLHFKEEETLLLYKID